LGATIGDRIGAINGVALGATIGAALGDRFGTVTGADLGAVIGDRIGPLGLGVNMQTLDCVLHVSTVLTLLSLHSLFL
jgi:uncharacterized protein YcfJ